MTLIEDHTGLRHEAFVYDDDEEFVRRISRHLARAEDDVETAIAVLTRSNRTLMREALGPSSQQVLFVDCDAQYLRPARTLAAYDALIRQVAAERRAPVRVVAEMPPSQTPAEGAEWLVYEAIFNRALAHLPVSVVCLYDARVVSDAVIDAVWATHPWSFSDGGAANPRYHEPEDAAAVLAPVPRRLAGLEPIDIAGDATCFRERLAAAMVPRGIPQGGIINMLLAATEVFENARRHGGGATGARVGTIDARFVCEISDAGPGLADPMSGYYPPSSRRSPGTGLWVARQVVFRLEVLSRTPGTTVRLWL